MFISLIKRCERQLVEEERPKLLNPRTECHILVTPAVPLGRAAHLAGQALLDAGLEDGNKKKI